MDALVNSSLLIVHRLKKSIDCQLSVVSCCQRRRGFTIIELLVVISLLGITTTLVSAAYLSFERRERVKTAALDLKSNLRFAQNKALTGDKGIPGSGEECAYGNTLVGWFVRLDTTGSSYEIVGTCQSSPGAETEFFRNTVRLPKGVSLTQISYAGASQPNLSLSGVNILFRPIDRGVYSFYPSPTPPFINADGNLNGLIEPVSSQESVRLTLNGFDTTYEVNIFTSGEINEKKL